jgi:uncharacterized protein (DUF433 family)
MSGGGKDSRQGERCWTFRNSRTPVKLVFENLEDGMNIDEIIEQYPVSREEIVAVLEFAVHRLDNAPRST